MQSLKHTKS